ncbi:LysR substrate-binding domain-containing protein [Marinomonas sp. C2222]|uniref:LysR substrate-binding domain-containing protein n=1 Tax=Marinomonas sargassi TaxID=2984494 RepID=A0ABT2YPU8_9GAMM|nr:LysR substrate-binding domain-containing protein [Marinomonas sargassi]MCV2401881.1 LysR substrate-binding domain-containing protein [Marinomonas sargassi]
MQLSLTAWGDSQFEEMLAGKVDLGIKRVNDTPNNIRSKLIGYTEACIVLGEAHPLHHQDEIMLKDLLAHKLVTHHMEANRQHSTFAKTEQKLKQQGFHIRADLETDSLMVAMQAVNNGMALVASRSIGELFLKVKCEESISPVKLLPIPKEVLDLDDYNGRHPIHIFWHERFNNDLAHRWLREKIIAFMRESPWMHSPK